MASSSGSESVFLVNQLDRELTRMAIGQYETPEFDSCFRQH